MAYIPNPLDIGLSGGRTGILVLHGFTGSPESVRPWVEGFHEAGFTVLSPALPGHGTQWEDLNQTTWSDWYERVEEAFLELKSQCDRVFVAGFSVGGALALRLAQIRGSEMEGLLLCNASIFDDRKALWLLPLVKRFLSSTKNGAMDVNKPTDRRHSYTRMPLRALDSLRGLWKIVEENLYFVDVPLMVSYSINDHVVHPINSETIIENVYSANIREIIFEKSFHNVAWDYDSDFLVAESVQFIFDVLTGEIDDDEEVDERDLINAEFDSIVSTLNLNQATDTTYLDELDKISHFEEPKPKTSSLSQASKFSLAAIIASGIYVLIEGFNGGDPFNMGGWPAVALFFGGVVSFIWRTSQKRSDADDGDDGAVI